MAATASSRPRASAPSEAVEWRRSRRRPPSPPQSVAVPRGGKTCVSCSSVRACVRRYRVCWGRDQTPGLRNKKLVSTQPLSRVIVAPRAGGSYLSHLPSCLPTYRRRRRPRSTFLPLSLSIVPDARIEAGKFLSKEDE